MADVFYWVVKIGDNEEVPQFDYNTGSVNKIGNIPKKLIKGVSWRPFTNELVRKIDMNGGNRNDFIVNPYLPTYSINIPDGAFPLVEKMKEGTTSVLSLKKCLNCKHEFKFNPKEHESIYVKHMGRSTITCPKCGLGDGFICRSCGNLMRDNTNSPEICPKCNKRARWVFKRYMTNTSVVENHMKYMLGYIDGIECWH